MPVSPPKRPKRAKTGTACLYCRRSHMTCSTERPCSRCVRRNIGHLCHDEVSPRLIAQSDHNPAVPSSMPTDSAIGRSLLTSGLQLDRPYGGGPALGTDFYHLEDFTSIFSEDMFPSLHSSGSITPSGNLNSGLGPQGTPRDGFTGSDLLIDPTTPAANTALAAAAFVGGIGSTGMASIAKLPETVGKSTNSDPPINLKPITTDEFMLMAADPDGNTSERRLSLVITMKHKAGLLQPYDYPAGYDRLRKYMDQYMSDSSQQRILRSLSTFRPAFRAIAKSAMGDALEQVEENFERMLLDYDRIFAAMSMPSCLWRRTGEIYRANKEFAELVGVQLEELREGNMAIYELMSEESAVTYWEKFGSVAFQPDRKAIMSTCNLRRRNGRKRRHCCFCFTIRRDRHNIPNCIVGNFIPIKEN